MMKAKRKAKDAIKELTLVDDYRFETYDLKVPEFDCDIVLNFPSGKSIAIQCRPSNADTGYNGALDIIVPEAQIVTLWTGNDMDPAPAFKKNNDHIRTGVNQIVLEIP